MSYRFAALLHVILLSVVVIRSESFAQTHDEFVVYQAAQRELETAKRLIKEGLSLSSTPDTNGLNGLIDHSDIRQRGRNQVASGRQLAADAEKKISAYLKRQEALRELLANRNRVLELEAVDGRRAVFGIESIALPRVSLVRPDLRVMGANLEQFSPATQQALRELADPRVDFESLTSYGGHFFPVAYLAKPKLADAIKRDNEDTLPVFELETRIFPRKDNVAHDGDFTIRVSSSWEAVRPVEKRVKLRMSTNSESIPVRVPLEFDEAKFASSASAVRELEVEVLYGSAGRYRTRLKMFEHGLNDLPLYIQEPGGQVLDTKYLAASYVDETLPAFEEVKRVALERKLVDSFGGNTRELSATRAELFAVWHYLGERGVKYSSATETGNVGGDYASQRVRFPSEIESSTQANCIDCTIYIASFAYHIGLDPILIIRPGHMYLAVRNTAKRLVVLETTVIGSLALSAEMSPEERLRAIRENFELAESSARKTLSADLNLIDRALVFTRYYPGAVDLGGLAQRFQFIDVRKMRESGIPIVRPPTRGTTETSLATTSASGS